MRRRYMSLSIFLPTDTQMSSTSSIGEQRRPSSVSLSRNRACKLVRCPGCLNEGCFLCGRGPRSRPKANYMIRATIPPRFSARYQNSVKMQRLRGCFPPKHLTWQSVICLPPLVPQRPNYSSPHLINLTRPAMKDGTGVPKNEKCSHHSLE